MATPYHLFDTLQHLNEMCTKCLADICKMLMVLYLGESYKAKMCENAGESQVPCLLSACSLPFCFMYIYNVLFLKSTRLMGRRSH